MPKKLSYETVKEYIRSKGDELISKVYTNTKTPLELKCGKCGALYKQIWGSFTKGYQHQHCPNAVHASTTRKQKASKKIDKFCVICNGKYTVINNKRETCSHKCQHILERNTVISKTESDNKKCRGDNLYIEKIRNFRNECKLDQVCEHCGEENPNLFDFAHYNRNNKSFHMRVEHCIEVLKTELPKGRFLCCWCHRLETRAELDVIKRENFKKWIVSEDELRLLTDENSKPCKGLLCNGNRRLLSSFYSNKRKGIKETYFSICKGCNSYNRRIERDNAHKFVDNIKLEIGGCSLCERKVTQETTSCFDFDHLDPFYKEYTISNMCQDPMKNEEIAEEIQKCRLLCCNCHRLHTANQFNHTDYSNYNYEERVKIIEDRHDLIIIRPTGPKAKLVICC